MAVFRMKEEERKDPTGTVGGWMYINLTKFSSSDVTNWIDPGDYYFMVQFGQKADGSPATQQEIDTANAELTAMPQNIADGIETFHNTLIRRQDNQGPNDDWLLCMSNIPATLLAFYKAYNAAQFQWLGDNATEAKQAFNTQKWNRYWPAGPNWPDGFVSEVISGWEHLAL